MGAVETIALAMGVGWASGINLYAAIATLGLLQLTGNITLPPELAVVSHPMVLGAAIIMYGVEFFADKIPGVDTGWDAIHTFIRIPAGAILAAQVVAPVGEPAMLAAGLVGGAFATGSHLVKAGSRVVINTSPEPFTNWTASLAEDAMVVAGVWASLYHPGVFLVGLAIFVAVAIWLLPKIWRGILRVTSAVANLFRSGSDSSAAVAVGPSPGIEPAGTEGEAPSEPPKD